MNSSTIDNFVMYWGFGFLLFLVFLYFLFGIYLTIYEFRRNKEYKKWCIENNWVPTFGVLLFLVYLGFLSCIYLCINLNKIVNRMIKTLNGDK